MSVIQTLRNAMLVSVALLLLAPAEGVARDNKAAKARTVELVYEATVTGLKKKAAIWVPVPPEMEEQDVEVIRSEIDGIKVKIQQEKRSGNRMAFAEVEPTADGKATLSFAYRITRREIRGKTQQNARPEPATLKRFLQADSLVPINGTPLTLLKGKVVPRDKMKQARLCYDVVNAHMRYSKEGTGWGRGDSVWACDSKYGNCTDFHSLFLSLTRSLGIATKFEIGFALPVRRGEGVIAGYHCWALFQTAEPGWVPVDISEANKDPKQAEYYFGNLTEDRVTFSTGRDLELVPKQRSKALNYFVYPHVEVEGKEHPRDLVATRVAFKDRK